MATVRRRGLVGRIRRRTILFGAQAQVERLVTSRVGIAEIEDYIEGLVVVPADIRSALWLFAWAETRRQERGHAKVEDLGDLAVHVC